MGVIDKFQDIQEWFEDRISQIGKGKYSRVLKMARKPTREEYIRVVEITAFGIALIGVIGFIIYLLMSIVFQVP
ncbi:MAG: protein translocase SEC61 complex subunit gamma [Thermoplasmata archaeon]